MAENTKSRTWLTPLTVALALVVAGFLLYFAVQIRSAQYLVKDRSQRAMASVARSIQDKMDNLDEVLERAAGELTASRDGADQPPAAAPGPLGNVGPGGVESGAQMRLTPGLCPQGVDTGVCRNVLAALDNAHFHDYGMRVLNVVAAGAEVERAETRFSRADASDAKGFRFSHGPVPYLDSGKQETCCLEIHGTLGFEEVFGALDPGELFDDVFVAHGYDVLHRKADHGPRVVDLQGIRSPARVQLVRSESAAPVPFGEFDPSGTTQLLQVEIGGAPYWLFLEPVELTRLGQGEAGGRDGGPSLLLGGLLEADRFVARTQKISPTLVVAIVLAITLTILIFPFFRVLAAGPHERLRRSDLWLLGLASFATTALLTLIVLDAVFSFSVRGKQLDERLQALSDDLEAGLVEELDLALAQIETMSPYLARDADSALLQKQDASKNGAVPEPASYAMRRGQLLDYRTRRPDSFPYPLFKMLVWMDPDGNQLVKWSSAAAPTAPGNFRKRRYFTEPKEGRLWKRPDVFEGRGFYVEVIRSKTTNATQEIVSIPVDAQGRFAGEGKPAGVATLVAPGLRSLVDPVLPPDFGFAVVDPDQAVLFHSDAGLRLQEDLLREMTNGTNLAQVIEGGERRSFDATYRGRDVRVYARQLSAPPWTLVVFADLAPFRAANVEILEIGLVALGVYGVYGVAIVLLVAWIARGTAQKGVGSWAWPRRVNTRAYFECALACALVFVGVVAWCMSPRQFYWGALAVASVSPPFALLTCWAACSGGRWPRLRAAAPWALAGFGASLLVASLALDGSGLPAVQLGAVGVVAAAGLWLVHLFRERLTRAGHAKARLHRVGYLAALQALIAVVGVAPAAVIFHDAQIEVMTAAARAEQLELTDAVQAYQKGLDKLEPAEAGAFLKSRLEKLCGFGTEGSPAAPWPVYPRGWFPLEVRCGTQPAGGGDPPTALAAYAPHFVRPAGALVPGQDRERRRLARARGLPTEAAAGAPHAVTPADCRPMEGCAATQVDAPEPGTRLESRDLSPAWAQGGWSASATMLVAVVLVGVALMARSVVRRALGLDVVSLPVERRSLEEWARDRPPQSAVLCGLSEQDRETLLQKWSTRCIDTRDLPPAGDIDRLVWAATPLGQREGGGIVLDHFEHRLKEPEYAARKLALLERLVYQGARLIYICSDVDPLLHLGGREEPPDGEGGVGAPSPDLERWAAVLARFEVVHFAAAEHGARTDDGRGALRRECAWNRRLAWIAETRRDLEQPEEAVPARVLELARPEYQRIWSLCTQEEEAVLFRLAEDGLVNPGGWETARRLEQRGLIVRKGRYDLVCESFRRFVREAPQPEELRHWEQAAASSNWRTLRNLLLALLGVIGAFLFMTQREIFNATVAYVIAVGGGLPVLMYLLKGRKS